MDDDELEALIDAAEEDVAAEARAILDEVAEEFAAALADATELVAARFSVSRIGQMWARRMPRFVRRLLGVAESAASATADAVDAQLPDGWDDLPGRYTDGTLPEGLGAYVDTTEHLMRAVGDRLSARAVDALAEGLGAGEDTDALRARLRAVFTADGAELGEMREERIARTEAGRAWNTATLAAARELAGPDRPIVKQWKTRRDALVRDAHDAVDGQLRLLDQPFTVAGVAMQAPLDPAAPAALVVNCRCVLVVEARPAPREDDSVASLMKQVPGLTPEGAQNILAFEAPTHPAVQPATSQAASVAPFTNPRNAPQEQPMGSLPDLTAAAADGEHTGAMIALVPTAEDAERLALDDGEPVDELHLTLFYLGEGADWGEEQRRELIANVRSRAEQYPPLNAHAFGVNLWNPAGDEPAWVYAIGDDRGGPDDATTLHELHNVAIDALENGHNNPDLPQQHSPWAPHTCAAYSADTWPLEAMADRVGPVTYDRIRVAFGGEITDIPLGTGTDQEQETMPDTSATAAAAATATEAPPVEAPPVRGWSTPDDTALAFEDMETGDGRLFPPGAIYWDAPGPWPLQYAEQMLMGHEGAQLAGAINTVARDTNRITGTGVLYLNQPAGLDAATLLEQEAPLGVSVDLDDVDVEFVDRTLDPDEDGYLFASARLPSASVLRLEDGAVMLSASTAPRWVTADGALSRARHDVQLITGPASAVTAAAIRDAFGGRGMLTAAAGDSDDPDGGIVVHAERAGDFLMRITRGRLRGATLVSMPAYAGARIVLDPLEETASATPPAVVLAAAASTLERVVVYVRTSPAAVGPREVAAALGIGMTSARKYLATALQQGSLVALAPNLYAAPCNIPEGASEAAATTTVTASSGSGGRSVNDALDRLSDLAASAWTVMQDADPLPASWFREPTPEELPPGSGGVHYSAGRVYGWVAQAGSEHAGFPGRRLTIESLGKIDLSHFLRAKFALDDGSTARVGAFTMNVPHGRDGAECDDVVCQFDDSRTVAGIVTVGMNAGGMWFSGAAAPWLSEWDRHVFNACQPSYHMKQAPGGRGWELRAVLSVPVPGHSTPLAAAAVERANVALAASAAGAVTAPDTVPGHALDTASTVSVAAGYVNGITAPEQPGHVSAPVSGHARDTVSPATAQTLATALLDNGLVNLVAAAMEQREAARRAEIEQLAASMALTPDEITASATPTEGAH